MSRIRYVVAVSLDGYIAGPNGEADWISMDSEINFGELWAQFDTFLMGRRTYEAATLRLGSSTLKGRKSVVVSRTMQAEQHPDLTIISNLERERIQALRAGACKDIWLLGGAELFGSLLHMGEVDTVEVSVMPVLLGTGVPLSPPLAGQTRLTLTAHRLYPSSGITSLTYSIVR